MATIPAQLSEPLAKKYPFRRRELKGDGAAMPTVRPLREGRERRLETEERLPVVISRRARAV